MQSAHLVTALLQVGKWCCRTFDISPKLWAIITLYYFLRTWGIFVPHGSTQIHPTFAPMSCFELAKPIKTNGLGCGALADAAAVPLKSSLKGCFGKEIPSALSESSLEVDRREGDRTSWEKEHPRVSCRCSEYLILGNLLSPRWSHFAVEATLVDLRWIWSFESDGRDLLVFPVARDFKKKKKC